MDRIFILKYIGNNAMLLAGGQYLFIDSSNKEDEQLINIVLQLIAWRCFQYTLK